MLVIIFAERHRTGRWDLEAVEMATRTAMHQAGAEALTQLLRLNRPQQPDRECPCGQRAQYRELRSKQILTVVGKVTVRRPYYLCPCCHRGQIPLDGELDVEGTQFSAGVRRMMALVGSESPFDSGREQMRVLAELTVTAKAVERTAEAIGEDILARQQVQIQQALQLELPLPVGQPIPILYVEIDGTGVPVVKKETEGRAGKVEGQRARTREGKFGCVFTQTTFDAEGRPVRDLDSTTYTGVIETAEKFSPRIYTEAYQRGWSRAQTKVVIGDGADWIWNLAQEQFPRAIQIVDLYHAREHLWKLAGKLFPADEPGRRRWVMIQQDKLDNGKIEKLVAALRSLRPHSQDLLELIRKEANYFEGNASRMRYPEFRRQGLFVGSGVIEAGCKTLVTCRLKRSGMFWTVRGANGIIALRCTRLSGRFEDYWEARRA